MNIALICFHIFNYSGNNVIIFLLNYLKYLSMQWRFYSKSLIHTMCIKIELDDAGALFSTRHEVNFNNTCILAVIMKHFPRIFISSQTFTPFGRSSLQEEHSGVNIRTANDLFLKKLPVKHITMAWGSVVTTMVYSSLDIFQTIVGAILGHIGSNSKQNQISELLISYI